MPLCAASMRRPNAIHVLAVLAVGLLALVTVSVSSSASSSGNVIGINDDHGVSVTDTTITDITTISSSASLPRSSAGDLGRSFVYHDRSLASVPHQWEHMGRARDLLVDAAVVPVTFYIALAQGDVEGLRARLEDIADPRSPRYSRWLSPSEVRAMVQASAESIKAVLTFLRTPATSGSTGLVEAVVVPAGDAIKVVATTHYIESLFHTELHAFVHERERTYDIKHVGPLYLPEELREHVAMVMGITNFTPRQRRKEAVRSSLADAIIAGGPCNTPVSMRALYNMTDADMADGNRTQDVFAEAEGKEGFGRASLFQFQTANDLTNNTVKHVLGSGASGYYAGYNDGEAILDVEMITAFGQNATTSFFIMDTHVGWMYEFTQEIANSSVISEVHSISYGYDEVDQCVNNSYNEYHGHCVKYGMHNYVDYIDRTNIEFMKLTAQGQTFVDASGDAGVGGEGYNVYSGTVCHGKSIPEYPQTSPWMVIVGSTISAQADDKPLDNSTWARYPICTPGSKYSCECNTGTSLAATMITNYGNFDSGGGYSLVTPMPSWQKEAVYAYMQTPNLTFPNPSSYNATNRAFPDVSLIGGNVAVFDGVDGIDLIGGTSCSTPEFAGMVSSLNSARKAAGKNVLGYMNPLIYTAGRDCPACFVDVTVGFNGHGGCHNEGFHAAPGWDPVTGWGHLNYGVFKEYVLSLP